MLTVIVKMALKNLSLEIDQSECFHAEKLKISASRKNKADLFV